MNVYWNNEFVADPCAPSDVLKTAEIVKKFESEPVEGVNLVDPMSDFYADGRWWISSFDECALEHVQKVHTPEYVQAVRTGSPAQLAASPGIPWSESVYTAAIAQVSGVMAAVHHALEWRTQSGVISPNMNHARSGSGEKQCVFNGIAAAVSYAVTGWDLTRILVIDCDKEWADGTEEILASQFADRTTHVDVASIGGGQYLEREGNTAKSVSKLGYADRTEMAVQRMLADDTFDLVIYNAGMNPVETGVEVTELALRERMVRAYIGDIPAVFLSGGGRPTSRLTMDELVDLHLLTLREWARYGRLSS